MRFSAIKKKKNSIYFVCVCVCMCNSRESLFLLLTFALAHRVFSVLGSIGSLIRLSVRCRVLSFSRTWMTDAVFFARLSHRFTSSCDTFGRCGGRPSFPALFHLRFFYFQICRFTRHGELKSCFCLVIQCVLYNLFLFLPVICVNSGLYRYHPPLKKEERIFF